MPAETHTDHVGQSITTLSKCAIYQKTLRISCRKCLHVAVIPSVPVWWLFERRRWNQALWEAVRRFYCADCWTRRGVKVLDPYLRVVDEKITSDPLPWPDERTWKKLVGRFRA